jgi:LacI family transcriptional regulator
LRAHPEITAILAHNDLYAGSLHATLTGAGYRIPEEMSLVSFDDTDPVLNAHGHNILTTVHIPLLEIGQAAGRVIIGRVTGEMLADTTEVLPVRLTERASTAPPAR